MRNLWSTPSSPLGPHHPVPAAACFPSEGFLHLPFPSSSLALMEQIPSASPTWTSAGATSFSLHSKCVPNPGFPFLRPLGSISSGTVLEILSQLSKYFKSPALPGIRAAPSPATRGHTMPPKPDLPAALWLCMSFPAVGKHNPMNQTQPLLSEFLGIC